MNLRMAASPWNEPDSAGRWARYSSHQGGGQVAVAGWLNGVSRDERLTWFGLSARCSRIRTARCLKSPVAAQLDS